MNKPREVITLSVTGNWLAHCMAASLTKPGPLFFQDEMGPLDAPEWIPTGGVSAKQDSGITIVHSLLR